MSVGPLPSLVVLDLDMCVWTPEMYELYDMPSSDKVIRGDLNGRGEGVTGVYSGSRVIRMFPGALVALQESHDGVHDGLKLSVASSADTPLAEQVQRSASSSITAQQAWRGRFAVTCLPISRSRALRRSAEPP